LKLQAPHIVEETAKIQQEAAASALRLSKKHQISQKKQVQAPEIVEETANIKIRSSFKRPDIVEETAKIKEEAAASA